MSRKGLIMHQKDLAEKLLFDYNDVFADVINGYVFKGNQTINENQLKDSKIRTQFKADDNKLHEQERDILKEWCDSDIRIAICGIENQTIPDEYMPLRVMSYDGASYKSQLIEKTKQVVPVITVVLYFGTEKRWEYPRNLKKILNIPPEIDDFVNDYRINILEVAWLDESELERFSGDFKIVANFLINRRKNPGYIPNDPTVIKHYDEMMKLLTIVTNDKKYEEIISIPTDNKEARSMCTVAQNLINIGRNEGRIEGRNEGRNEEKKNAIEHLTEFFRKENPDFTPEQAREMATTALKY